MLIATDLVAIFFLTENNPILQYQFMWYWQFMGDSTHHIDLAVNFFLNLSHNMYMNL